MKKVLAFMLASGVLLALAFAGGNSNYAAATEDFPGRCYRDAYCQAEMGAVISADQCRRMGGHSFRPEGRLSCERL